MLNKFFNDHPASIGETYGQHFRQALSFSATLFAASLACLIHAILPCFFKDTGSGAVRKLHEEMIRKRAARAAPAGVRTQSLD